VVCIRRVKNPPHRILLLGTLAAPSGAAIVDWGITRGMVFIIPTLLITALGFELIWEWIKTRWRWLRTPLFAWGIFLVFATISFWTLGDALTNGPTWYDNYGLSGLQYGGRQLFSRAAEIARKDPTTTVLVSSTWANAPHILLRYFGNDLPNLRMGNINAFGMAYQPLDRSLLFVMTDEDLAYIHGSGKFINITIEETLPYPDGRAGFYFMRLEYMPDIQDVLAAERAERQALRSETLPLMGQVVEVQYPMLDMNEIRHAFDGDPTTVIRTLEANPLRLILTFPKPILVTRITLLIGGTPTHATLTAHIDAHKPVTVTEQVERDVVKRDLQLTFNQPYEVNKLEIEVLNPHDGEIAHVHLWEVTIE